MMDHSVTHLRIVDGPEPDRVEILCGVPRWGAPRSIRILARGWLIERERSRALREALAIALIERDEARRSNARA